MSAYIVDIDPETGSIKRTLKNACGGTPPRIGRQPAEREVCGRPGRELIGGVWVCVSHRGAFTAEADLRAAELAAATREHVVPPGRCTFPARGGDSAVPLCGLGAEDRIGTAWACPRHFHEVVEWVRARDRAMEHEARELADREREAELATWKASGPQVVYYLRATGGAVKIGTSTEFDRRYGNLVREHGPLDILLTHCGAFEREHEMHRKFARLWIKGEWFRCGPELLEWIIYVRRKPANARTVLEGTVPLGEIRKLLAEARREQAKSAA